MDKKAGKEKAKERILILFDLARQKSSTNPVLSKRYITLARKIAMKFKIRLNRQFKMLFCRKCNSYLVRGENSTYRIKGGNCILRCTVCGHVRRFGYTK